MPIVSDYETVEMCLDKYQTYGFLSRHGFPAARSHRNKCSFYRDVDAGLASYPVIVKPVRGSASIGVRKVYTKQELELLSGDSDDLLIQECIVGTELGVDAYVDMLSGEIVAIFAKEKIRMRAGETDKSVSMKDSGLFELIDRFVKAANLRGVIDLDIFRINSDHYISEINPRFGGGYPHAYECGVNIPRMIIRNLEGTANVADVGRYDEGVYMMKYSDVKIVRPSASISELSNGT